MRTARVAANGVVQQAVSLPDGTLQLENGQLLKETDVVFLPPVKPRTVFVLGLNYADHAGELSFKAPEEPLVFLKGPNTFVGHRSLTYRPDSAQQMHYECELGVVIGKTGKHIKREDAYHYVKGYTIANDYAIRDYLENYYRPNLRVKNRDTCTPIGPYLVDAEAIDDPMNLALRTYVNGELKQEGNTCDMIFDIPFLIEYLSSFMTLSPNDIILTGTPKGLANVFAGDEVITEIQQIGRLVNTIAGDETFTPKKGADRHASYHR
ncbi:5-oxopent-3-ene-1,2,5-tricarboxylate decarboxylase/2-hydroxyhepta-2,4-diene-1,7-dioate isomerase [Alkalihalobacillus xiaoxiensis]|uniref:5-oxopent-3-ene-1,2,5-tricarboxylate decarboxylase/2-hydroxyhepta-2,4-diene-1,7-dioate isomerase n=1 Tax=Shouchella xiaoxiensis TaxID=766895 RepID=A0ABS2SYJ7_9BACI|nr:fumarylacetoacetate hydrolase family protein [Shouchella xiaoxiensis]MBM7839292.1 5-oxopent-3-ene-1,2,5-tricarboxylate decarboxylase/2-hydroxyhepta-2,4-diene-1,7-dioate isomerase [Shouchella xiaoxiensis]